MGHYNHFHHGWFFPHLHIQKTLPMVYDNSLSYYEVLCRLAKTIDDILEIVSHYDPEGIEAYVREYVDDKLSSPEFTTIVSGIVNNIISKPAFRNMIVEIIEDTVSVEFDSATETLKIKVGD